MNCLILIIIIIIYKLIQFKLNQSHNNQLKQIMKFKIKKLLWLIQILILLITNKLKFKVINQLIFLNNNLKILLMFINNLLINMSMHILTNNYNKFINNLLNPMFINNPLNNMLINNLLNNMFLINIPLKLLIVLHLKLILLMVKVILLLLVLIF